MAKQWMSDAVTPAHQGKLRALVADRYGAAGFERSPRTGHQIIRPAVLRQLRRDPDPHVRGMADFAYNARQRGAARRTADRAQSDRASALARAAGKVGGR